MTCSTHSSTPIGSHHSAHKRCRGHWSGLNIAAMVMGFIIFPPLGLVVLFWTLSGRPIQDLPTTVRNKWNDMKSEAKAATGSKTDNVVFNEYQQTQYDRITEIKEEINDRDERFDGFRSDVQRRKDQKEFDKFMAHTPVNKDDA